MLGDIMEAVGKLLLEKFKKAWRKRELRLHLVTWALTTFLAGGLYLYIGFRVTEVAALADTRKQMRDLEIGSIHADLLRIENQVNRLVDALIEPIPRRMPAGR